MSKLLLLFLLAGLAAQADEAIREFPIATIEALGQDLYRRDQMAATAFDTLFAEQPKAREAPIRGWITQVDKERQAVYFIQEQDSQYAVAYLANFHGQGPPEIADGRGAALPDFVAVRYAARRTAIEAVRKFLTRTYNFEVLDDPERGGFLVYALASTHEANEVMIGGHYRVTVSADGKTAQQVDALSRSMLILNKQSQEVPKGANVVGFSMSHLVSKTPVETHVFASLLHHVPLFVGTMDKQVWSVSEGKITKGAALGKEGP